MSERRVLRDDLARAFRWQPVSMLLGWGALLMGGCASAPDVPWDVHHVGRIESTRVVQTNRPTGYQYIGLYALGAGGAAAATLMKGPFPSQVHRYGVRTRNNELVEVEWPEVLPIGSCVAVLGARDDMGGLSYPFPMGRVTPSAECR